MLSNLLGQLKDAYRKALEELQREGYLEKKQGKGTFVRNILIEQKLGKFYSFSEDLKKRGVQEKARMLEFEIEACAGDVAAGLRVGQGEQVFKISRLRLADETPYAHEVSYIPCQVAAGLTEQMVRQDGLYRSLGQLGISVDNAVEKLRAVNLDAETACLLGTRPDAAAIHLIRTAGCGTVTVEYCVSTVVGDFFSYTVELN